jgi:hypothetical protein
LECGGLTPLWSLEYSPVLFIGRRSGVKPPHSKIVKHNGAVRFGIQKGLHGR